MDSKTIQTYDEQSARYAEGWITQPLPAEIYRRVQAYFKKGQPTADIGSGSGRDTAWLHKNGYPVIGYDASLGLITEARRRFPSVDFRQESLPILKTIPGAAFEQILCETVLMHLAESDHVEAFKNLLRALKPGGVLVASWRMPETTPDGRDEDGRLYSKVDFDLLKKGPLSKLVKILEHQEIVSPSSGKRIFEVVVRKK